MLELNTWGGAREGAGRPAANERPDVPHVERELGKPSEPVHVTVRLRDGVPSLRQDATWVVIVAVMTALRERTDFRVVHYSVMTNHLHLLVEADGKEQFFDGMKALLTPLALQLNRHFGRKGRLFAGRYHSHVLTTPREVKNALLYVLLDARKHAAESGDDYAPHWLDPYSSAATFRGWSRPMSIASAPDVGTSPAQTWYLREGWRKAGTLDPTTIPGGTPRRARTKRNAA
ncbi:MAG TPA: transposase [Nannocystaceae bacterium]|nr:transposase [Nannocystaceae bacterium]